MSLVIRNLSCVLTILASVLWLSGVVHALFVHVCAIFACAGLVGAMVADLIRSRASKGAPVGPVPSSLIVSSIYPALACYSAFTAYFLMATPWLIGVVTVACAALLLQERRRFASSPDGRVTFRFLFVAALYQSFIVILLGLIFVSYLSDIGRVVSREVGWPQLWPPSGPSSLFHFIVLPIVLPIVVAFMASSHAKRFRRWVNVSSKSGSPLDESTRHGLLSLRQSRWVCRFFALFFFPAHLFLFFLLIAGTGCKACSSVMSNIQLFFTVAPPVLIVVLVAALLGSVTLSHAVATLHPAAASTIPRRLGSVIAAFLLVAVVAAVASFPPALSRGVHDLLIALTGTSVESSSTDVGVISGEARAVSPDTLEIDGAQVRLYGLEAFDPQKWCPRDPQSWACYKYAWAGLRGRASGRVFHCVLRGQDEAGRMLAFCKYAGTETDLAALLVSEGRAFADRQVSDAYVPGELGARVGGRGIWWGGHADRYRKRSRWLRDAPTPSD